MIHNPILPGFNPDPCICRKNDDYYLAVSTFEWFPGIPVYHSKDLVHWELYTHILTDDEQVDLKKLPSAKGIWAPCLTYCEAEDLFYVVYGVMNSMNARYFDVDNFVITAKDIKGPWSRSVYLHSAGFDASMFHDDDGRKYVVSLDWETQENYEKPGAICLVEYDPVQKEIIGYPKRIWRGGTDRGGIEAPHLTKRGQYYYLMCAEDGWLRLADGGNLAKLEVEAPNLPEVPMPEIPSFDDFDGEELGIFYYAPRIMPGRFADLKARPGFVRLYGQESLTSLNKVSILARKLTSVYAQITTKMDFHPEVHQHSAGLILYYDNMNYLYLQKYRSETLKQDALLVIRMENGERMQYLDDRTPVDDGSVWMQLIIEGRNCHFEWSRDGKKYIRIGPEFETSKFSDEYCRYGEFTGTMVGITCADRIRHKHYADFDFMEYIADETKQI